MEVGERVKVFTVGSIAWLGSFLLALQLGAVDHLELEFMAQIRLPRVLTASVVGMGLSVSGAVLQALFVNPLCEPYTLGISSGAALGAVIGASYGLHWMFAGLAGTAFLGAAVFAAILYLVSLRPQSKNVTLLLMGVMLSFLGSSLMALWMTLTDSNGLQGLIHWLFGDLSRARLKGAVISGGFIFLLTLSLWRNWRELDALLLGEEGAETLGVDVSRVRRKLILITSFMIGICVSSAGMIGFVGLVVPHFARKLIGSLHLRLIPLCALGGAITLTLADCFSRVLIRPYELPIGVVTALIGSPLFVWIMWVRKETV